MDNKNYSLEPHVQEEVDKINKEFYCKFNYPWPPRAFHAFTHQEFPVAMLNQDIGSWDHSVIPATPKIWVAGCGTNQAVYTALRFPNSEVLGTDLSSQSLATAEKSAAQIGISNLKLEEKSINQANYRDQFDYIICTGVIHHNADPAASLECLAAALKPNGILELMVYNYYHMIFEVSFQEAIRKICRYSPSSSGSFEEQLSVTKKLVDRFPIQNLMGQHLTRFKDVHNDAELADMLIQPVLHSYTIEMFLRMVDGAHLECLLPCINQFDKAKGRLSWNLKFGDPETDAAYESKIDAERWHISNLLMMEQSPMLWFYLQRKDSGYQRKSEKEMCDDFLNTSFEKKSIALVEYLLNEEGRYVHNLRSVSLPNPPHPGDPQALKIFEAAVPGMPMKEIFHKLEIETSFQDVNRARILLTTSAFPYLKAVFSDGSDKMITREKVFYAQNIRQDLEDFGF